MRSVLVLAVLAVLAVARADNAELQQKLVQIATGCAQQNSYSQDGLNAFYAHIKTFYPNGGCFNKCVFENGGLLVGGRIDRDKIFAFGRLFGRTDADIAATYDRCSPLYNPSTFTCDVAWQMYVCFH